MNSGQHIFAESDKEVMNFKALMKHYCGVEDAPHNKLYGDRTFEEWSQNEFKEIFVYFRSTKTILILEITGI